MLPEQRVAAVGGVEEVVSPTCATSSSSRQSAVSDGTAKTTESDVASIAQQKSGIRLIDMPGARSLRIVTMKLIAPAVVEIPRKIRPSP